MSDSAHRELEAFRELSGLVHSLVDELASFRKRALTAEARLRELEAVTRSGDGADASERLAALEAENATLRDRLARATVRTRQLLERMKFLRQQSEGGVER